ncbi:neural cell adhesion molecule 1 [Elysia marginata]|uniref:Neural cell adhesion molecule 1 n=1 Tax=Elysia marginata TaxID=1093978 RepID=A0AAV4HG79_9GAST|nr:neural cell adhesion molecule 1 [Elysia marginata]
MQKLRNINFSKHIHYSNKEISFFTYLLLLHFYVRRSFAVYFNEIFFNYLIYSLLFQGGNSVKITETPVYSHTVIPATASTPVYYRSQCSVSVSVEELGEGTHSFLGYIYPDVTGGLGMVNGIAPDKTVTLSFPQVFQSCLTNMEHGYFIGKSARCTCSATSDGYPRGSSQWYKGDQTVGTNGDLDITYNKNNPEQVYTCEAKSTLGRKPGSTLRAKFAYSVQIASSSNQVNLCDNNNQVQVTCKISKDHVSPAPTFSFSVDGPRSHGPTPGTDSGDGNYYQSRFSLSPDVGGQYQVTCRVTITVTNNWQEKSTKITFNSPPQVTVTGQTYQGISLSNIVTLAEGYTGDVTCRVEGGYPGPHSTQLKCGQLENTGNGYTATVRFTTDTLTRDLDETVCTCTSQHGSGCYNNEETRFTLNVLYAPQVTFTKSSPSTEFNKGDNLDLTCSAQGNPDPTSLTLTRERKDDIITRVQAAELTYTLDSLDCLDTGVYVCSGQNSQGTTSKELSITVSCAQQFSPLFSLSPYIDGFIGEKAEIDVEIYGFPEPSVTLQRTDNSANLKSFPRHEVKYTSTVAPFGFVNVTISDVVEADYTNYTLTIDNGVGDALNYSFYLNQVKTRPRPEAGGRDADTESDSFNFIALIIGLVAVVILGICVLINVFLIRKIQDMKRRRDDYKETAGTYMVPVERRDIVNTLQTTEAPRPGHYEDIDGVHNTTHAQPASTSSPPLSRQDQKPSETSTDTHTTLVSASQPPGNAQYETICDMVQQSRLYNSTSPQELYAHHKHDRDMVAVAFDAWHGFGGKDSISIALWGDNKIDLVSAAIVVAHPSPTSAWVILEPCIRDEIIMLAAPFRQMFSACVDVTNFLRTDRVLYSLAAHFCVDIDIT